jgi:hypothetical protein
MANNQPRSNEGQHADYYDRTGSRLSSSMKAYDPTVASTAGGSVQSRGSSSFEQPTSPIMTSYYPTSAGIHAQQMSPYSTPSYSQFQPAHSSIDPSSTGYHLMPTMGGVSEVSSALGGIQSVEAQMHGSAGPGVALPMMNMGSPQEQGMDPGMYYHQQQYPSVSFLRREKGEKPSLCESGEHRNFTDSSSFTLTLFSSSFLSHFHHLLSLRIDARWKLSASSCLLSNSNSFSFWASSRVSNHDDWDARLSS